MKLDSVYPGSTRARSTSIEKIHQCWVEEGGEEGCGGRCPRATRAEPVGLLVAGVAVANSCQVVMPIFGILFLIVGTVLTVASYRGPEAGEDQEQYLDRVELTSNLRVLGPCCLAVGSAMLSLGLTLCLLSRRAAASHRLPYHCPLHGHFYPISPAPNHTSTILGVASPASWCKGGDEEPGTPQCPHSTRSSLSHHSPSPIPPFPTNSQSFSGNLSAGQFLTWSEMGGSMRSLSIGYDVASFPHSRSPSPPSEGEEEEGGVAAGSSRSLEERPRAGRERDLAVSSRSLQEPPQAATGPPT